jgi:hypothetical protein
MKWRCPQPGKARQKNCPDIKDNGLCARKEWSSSITYSRDTKLEEFARGAVHCERIKDLLREEFSSENEV